MVTACCDMSIDCLFKHHGRASRDALRAWSGWASSVIQGQRHKLDRGPRYLGRATTRRTTGRATSRADNCAIVPALSLHAGPDRNIRLDLLGPAAFGSGPSRSKESDTDRSGVEGGGYGKPNRDGPGSTQTYRYGRGALFMATPHVTVGTPHRSATTLYKGSVACGKSPL
jgi:hypothetical protein